MVPVGKLGQITRGADINKFVRILNDPENTGGFVILVSTSNRFIESTADLVNDRTALETYFAEADWDVKWRDLPTIYWQDALQILGLQLALVAVLGAPFFVGRFSPQWGFWTSIVSVMIWLALGLRPMAFTTRLMWLFLFFFPVMGGFAAMAPH